MSVQPEPGARGQPRGHGGRPSRLESAQLSDRILDVATALFLSDGFGLTSIEAGAKRAGLSKRTFYHRFTRKETLFERVGGVAGRDGARCLRMPRSVGRRP